MSVPDQKLPPGWEQCRDPKTGRIYYQNHITRTTQWEPPVAPVVAPVSYAPLPDGWSEAVDPRTGRTYYSNHITKSTQWERPVAPAAAVPNNEALPHGWAALKDAKTGRTYYSNHILKKTQWEKPVADASMDELSRQMSNLRTVSANNPQNANAAASAAASAAAAAAHSQLDQNKAAVSKYDMYKQVLRAVLIDGTLNEAEEMMLSQLREQHDLSYDDHERMLREIGVDPEKLKQMKDAGQAVAKKSNKECVVCLDEDADHVVLDCMHMCVCDGCAQSLLSLDAKKRICPVCRNTVRDIKKVFA